MATFSDLYRATLPDADINAIRRLSARVNVLPIVARADVLTNERLATIKLAIRNDLADAGIGFGIFDLDSFKNFQAPNDGTENLAPKANGDGKSAGTASPPPPATPSPVPPSLRLPYALISADIYAHSEGLSRIPPSRDDLVLQYTPSLTQTPISSSVKLTRGKFTRAFRWGTMDILDPNHCDFIHLRTAIFHHMRVCKLVLHFLIYLTDLSVCRLCKSTPRSTYSRSSGWKFRHHIGRPHRRLRCILLCRGRHTHHDHSSRCRAVQGPSRLLTLLIPPMYGIHHWQLDPQVLPQVVKQ